MNKSNHTEDARQKKSEVLLGCDTSDSKLPKPKTVGSSPEDEISEALTRCRETSTSWLDFENKLKKEIK